ncbi:MAG TPA: alpha-ketoglutarate-dependent dioxygenase AlkB [Wenzhouxiangella sp.]
MESIEFVPAGWIRLWPNFLGPEKAGWAFHQLAESLQWEQLAIRMFGRLINQPRLTAFYGERGVSYRYSGLKFSAIEWSGAIHELACQVSALTQHPFNSVLCNYYRDGQDSMGWHADDEPELGTNPVIASVSLGASRRFDLKPKMGVTGMKQSIWLPSGSCLLMGGDLQHHWLHQIPKTKRVNEPRINLTFRWIPG